MPQNKNIQFMKMWNFLYGCTRCSPACTNCYAISRCWRMMHNPKMNGRADGTVVHLCDTVTGWETLDWTGRVNFYEPALEIPFKIKKPTKFFVNAVSDTFHEKSRFSWIYQMMYAIKKCPKHEFFIPTKRLPNAVNRLRGYGVMPNVWILYSAWNQESFDAGLSHAAALKRNGWKVGVSLEPLLEPTNTFLGLCLDLVIVGPERAGKRSRPCKREWIDSVVRQCDAAGVEVVDKTVKEPE